MYELKITTVHTVKSKEDLEKTLSKFKNSGHNYDAIENLKKTGRHAYEGQFLNNDTKTVMELEEV